VPTTPKHMGVRLSPESHDHLTMLTMHYGITRGELVEYLLREEHARVVAEKAANGDSEQTPPEQRSGGTTPLGCGGPEEPRAPCSSPSRSLPRIPTDVDEEEIDAAEAQRFAGMVAVTRQEQARSI